MTITVSEWSGSRRDCACTYRISMQLLYDEEEPFSGDYEDDPNVFYTESRAVQQWNGRYKLDVVRCIARFRILR
jgi:hypothetical protein